VDHISHSQSNSDLAFSRRLGRLIESYNAEALPTSENNMSNQADLQYEFLQSLATGKTLANVYLINGIRLSGYLVAFDTYAVMLESASGRQLVFKHAISTVMPGTGDRVTRSVPEAASNRVTASRA